MNKLMDYNSSEFRKVVERLFEIGFAEKKNNEVYLKPPFAIEMSNKVATQITDSYKNDEETGGLMLASMKSQKGKLFLVIDEWHEVENVVEQYYQNMSKKKAYLAKPEEYRRVLQQNFSRPASEQLFPIHYHTHPTVDIQEDIRYFTSSSKLSLSDADKKASENRFIGCNDFNFFFLNAILTGNESEHRIIYYGKGVSGYEFGKVKSKQMVEGIFDVTEGIESDGWKLVARFAALAGGLAVAVNAHPLTTMEILNSLSDLKNNKEYFGTINKIGSTVINIPEQGDNFT